MWTRFIEYLGSLEIQLYSFFIRICDQIKYKYRWFSSTFFSCEWNYSKPKKSSYPLSSFPLNPKSSEIPKRSTNTRYTGLYGRCSLQAIEGMLHWSACVGAFLRVVAMRHTRIERWSKDWRVKNRREESTLEERISRGRDKNSQRSTRWNTRWDQIRWDQIRWDQIRWDQMRRDQMRRDKIRWRETKWDEMRWKKSLSGRLVVGELCWVSRLRLGTSLAES